jgi:hypothetical protein
MDNLVNVSYKTKNETDKYYVTINYYKYYITEMNL